MNGDINGLDSSSRWFWYRVNFDSDSCWGRQLLFSEKSHKNEFKRQITQRNKDTLYEERKLLYIEILAFLQSVAAGKKFSNLDDLYNLGARFNLFVPKGAKKYSKLFKESLTNITSLEEEKTILADFTHFLKNDLGIKD